MTLTLIQRMPLAAASVAGLALLAPANGAPTQVSDAYSSMSTATNSTAQEIQTRFVFARVINAPVNKVRKNVADAAHWHRWSAGVINETHCEVAATGGSRTCVLNGPDGSPMKGYRLEEKILLNDESEGIFRYQATNPPFPVKDVIGTVRTTALGATQTRVMWSLDFKASDQTTVDMVTGAVSEMYFAMTGGLEEKSR